MWTNADLIHWHIYAALGGDELITLEVLFDGYKQFTNHILSDMTDGKHVDTSFTAAHVSFIVNGEHGCWEKSQ